MFLVGLLSWWYSDGFIGRLKIITNRFKSTADFFSISLLFSTLFNPFRQISADSSGGSINNRLQSFLDRTISRFIGAFMRLIMIFVGIIVLTIQFISGVLIIFFWLISPILPAVGFIISSLKATL